MEPRLKICWDAGTDAGTALQRAYLLL